MLSLRQLLFGLVIALPLLVILACLIVYIDNVAKPRPTTGLELFAVAPPPPAYPPQYHSPKQQQQQQPRTPNGPLSATSPPSTSSISRSSSSLDEHFYNGANDPSSSPELLMSQHEKLLQQGASKSIFMEDEDQGQVDCPALCKPMTEAIDEGRLSYARFLALEIQTAHPQCEHTLADLYTKHSDTFLAQRPAGIPLSQIAIQATNDRIRIDAPADDPFCWMPGFDDDNSGIALEEMAKIVLSKWDTCCSQIASSESLVLPDVVQKECYHVSTRTLRPQRLCCVLYQGNLSYLRLPALRELSLKIRLMSSPENAYEIPLGQEGFLRKYDTSGVLWPTAYLLSNCISYPKYCGIEQELLEAVKGNKEGVVVSVELGAGIGAPSIAMSRLLQQRNMAVHAKQSGTPRVLATDRSMHALALTVLNCYAAGAPVLVTHIEDHTNLTQLRAMVERSTGKAEGGGFPIVLGSALESLYDCKTRDPRHTLWKVLDIMLDPSNPNAIAILAHSVGAVVPPSSGGVFERIKTISGNHYYMRTMSDDDSDFEISVYQRRTTASETGAYEL